MFALLSVTLAQVEDDPPRSDAQGRYLEGRIIALNLPKAVIEFPDQSSIEEAIKPGEEAKFEPGALIPYSRGEGQVVRLIGPTATVQMPGRQITSSYDPGLVLKPGQQVVLYETGGENSQVYVTEPLRMNYLYILLGLFVLAAVGIGRGRGLRGVIGTLASLLVLVLYVVPQIGKGANPLLTMLVGSVGILVLTIYFVHGFNRKTHAALAGTLIATIGGLILGIVFSRLMAFTGLNSEDAFFVKRSIESTDLLSLYLASVVVGVLGALNDVTVTQAAVVEQLAKTNPRYTLWELYRRAMQVGFDHIGSLINTLVLAYSSSALLLMLLVHKNLSDIPLKYILNGEHNAAEITSILIGCLSLILAVPFSTFIAARLFHGSQGRFVEQRWPAEERRSWVQEMMDKER